MDQKGSEKLSTQPYKGARDFYPENMRIRNYIFETWKKVCMRYGYEEYDGPLLEPFDLFAAKTGEEIVDKQLYSFEDKGGRKITIRPEMTPTLARMVAAKYKTLNFPLRWFSIANFWRYEKPQRGRQREFYQLNFDIFGVEGVEADFEVLSVALDIMKEFGAVNKDDKKIFKIRVGNRRFLEDALRSFGLNAEQIRSAMKVIDKKSRIKTYEFESLLETEVGLDAELKNKIVEFIRDPNPVLEKLLEQGSLGAEELYKLRDLVKKAKLDRDVTFDPSTIRGLDYYTGNVFEQFNLRYSNNRSMFGGGRYDNLFEIFTGQKLSGVGLAIGYLPFINFLKDYDLLQGLESKIESGVEYLVTLWPDEDIKKNQEYMQKTLEVADKLRDQGNSVTTWLEMNTKLDKQLKYADRKQISKVVIIGNKEIEEGNITIKDMSTGKQETLQL